MNHRKGKFASRVRKRPAAIDFRLLHSLILGACQTSIGSALATVLHARRAIRQIADLRGALAASGRQTAYRTRVAFRQSLWPTSIELVGAHARFAPERLTVSGCALAVDAIGRPVEACRAVHLPLGIGAPRIESVAVGGCAAIALVGTAITVGAQGARAGAARLSLGAFRAGN